MTAPENSAREYALHVLRAGLARQSFAPPPPGLDPQAFAHLATANRSGPLLHTLLRDVVLPPAWHETAARLEQTYHQALARGLNQLAEGARLAAALAEHGIPSLAFRGPFAASDLYNDPGVRPANDIDLLVPRAQRDPALAVAHELNYARCDPLTPLWFNRRHHFHWSLRHRATGSLCDLHWAVQQPYKPIRIEYAGLFARAEPITRHGQIWSRPAPDDALLLACIHLTKEYPVAALTDFDAPPPDELLSGLVWLPWLDIARILETQATRLDWSAIQARATAWRVLPDLAAGLAGARAWLNAPVPPAVTDALLPALQAEAAYLRSLGHDTLYAAAPQGRPGQYWSMFARFGLPHIFPPRSYFAPTQGLRLLACRAAHAARAGARLARGSLDGLARDLIVRCRQHPRQPAPPHNSGLPKHTSPHKMSAIENPYKPQGDPMLDNHTQFAKVGDVVRRQIADETILVPVRQTAEALDSIYSVNPVAARIWDLLDGHKSMGEIRAALLEEYDVAPAELDADIESFVAQLKGEQLIQEA